MVIRLFARLSIFTVFAITLVGCTKEGTLPATESPDFFQEPPALPPISYSPVDEPFIGFVLDAPETVDDDDNYVILDEDGNPVPDTQLFVERDDKALSLLSYDPSFEADDQLAFDGGKGGESFQAENPSVVVKADTGLISMLNTADDDSRQPEHTVYSRLDIVFVVTHASGENRALRQFTNPVCEIIPAQTVETQDDGAGNVLHKVINAPWVYVKTAVSSCNGSGTDYSDIQTRYFKLPLNYDANATKFELCAGEPIGQEVGVNTNQATCKTKKFSSVLESEARAQVIFAWELDDSTAALNDYRLTYGYLGFGVSEERFRFYDASRDVVWSQARNTERVDVGNDDEAIPYVFQLAHLSDYNYLLQLGRDLFVFNSTQDLFSKTFLDESSILVDRVYRLDAQYATLESREILSPVKVSSNGSDMLFLDQSKLLKHDYISASFTPDVADLPNNYSVIYEDQLRELNEFTTTRSFSQFDIQNCQNEGADDEELSQVARDALIDDCVNAHDVTDAQLPSPGEPWQFVTECDNLLGCSVVVDSGDYCVTAAELLVDPSLAELDNPCSAANYLHLNELDSPANNAELLGFLQYANAHVRELSLMLEGNTLFMLAKMKERELLLRYQYLIPLTSPIAEREQVMLGARYKHFGLRAQPSDNGMFITALRKSGTQENVCYKNYQRVSCDLGNEISSGTSVSCTGLDLTNGDCTNQFNEYASYPLYCSNAQIQAGACTEECTQQQIDDGDCAASCSPADILAGDCPVALQPVFHLMVDRTNAPFGKWLAANDYSNGALERKMYLLAAADSSAVSDEGVLENPSLWSVNSANDQLSASALLSLTNVDVEDVLPLRIENTSTAWLDVVSSDVVDTGGTAGPDIVTSARQIYIDAPFSVTPAADVLAEFQYLRVE